MRPKPLGKWKNRIVTHIIRGHEGAISVGCKYLEFKSALKFINIYRKAKEPLCGECLIVYGVKAARLCAKVNRVWKLPTKTLLDKVEAHIRKKLKETKRTRRVI